MIETRKIYFFNNINIMTLPLRKDLLGSKRKAINIYFVILISLIYSSLQTLYNKMRTSCEKPFELRSQSFTYTTIKQNGSRPYIYYW